MLVVLLNLFLSFMSSYSPVFIKTDILQFQFDYKNPSLPEFVREHRIFIQLEFAKITQNHGHDQ